MATKMRVDANNTGLAFACKVVPCCLVPKYSEFRTGASMLSVIYIIMEQECVYIVNLCKIECV